MGWKFPVSVGRWSRGPGVRSRPTEKHRDKQWGISSDLLEQPWDVKQFGFPISIFRRPIWITTLFLNTHERFPWHKILPHPFVFAYVLLATKSVLLKQCLSQLSPTFPFCSQSCSLSQCDFFISSSNYCSNFNTYSLKEPPCIQFCASLLQVERQKNPSPITSLPCSKTFHESLLSSKWSTHTHHKILSFKANLSLLFRLLLLIKTNTHTDSLSHLIVYYLDNCQHTLLWVHFVVYTCSLPPLVFRNLSRYSLFFKSTLIFHLFQTA